MCKLLWDISFYKMILKQPQILFVNYTQPCVHRNTILMSLIYFFFTFFNLQKKFMEKYKPDIKKYGMMKEYFDSEEFLMKNSHLTCEDTANYLVIWCIDLQVEEVGLIFAIYRCAKYPPISVTGQRIYDFSPINFQIYLKFGKLHSILIIITLSLLSALETLATEISH